MEQKLGYLFLKPDPKDGVFYRPLDFQYRSYRNFLEHRLNEIIEIDREIHSDKNGTEQHFIKIYDIEKKLPKNSPTVYGLKNKSYSCNVKFNVKLYKKTRVDRQIEEKVIMDYKGMSNNTINVPLLTNYGLGNIFGHESIIYPNEIGGTFLSNRSIEKIGINLLEKTTCWPKFKKIKPGQYSFSFSSISPPDIAPPIFRYFKILLDINQPENFVISSHKTFITVNILFLIQYLTNASLSYIEEVLLNGVDQDNNFLVSLIKILILSTQEKLQSNFSTTDTSKSKVKEWINHLIHVEHQDQKSKLSFQDFKHQMFKNFLPHIREESDINKGMYLLYLVKMFLFAIMNPKEYPDRDSHATRRIFTYGSYFEQVTIDELENFITKMKTEVAANLQKQNEAPVNYMTLTTMRFNTAFNNLLSGRFKKSEGHIRNHTHYSWIQNVTIPRSIGFYPDQVKIAKIFNCRQFHPSQYGFFCPADIPDHGETVGLIIQLAMHSYITSILTKDFKLLRKQIIEQIHNKLKVNPNNPVSSKRISKYKTGIPVIIENDIVCCIAREDARPLVQHLRACKRAGIMASRDYGVTFIEESYISQIRINIGSGRVVRPIFVVEDGKMVLEKYEKELEDFKGTWSEFLKEYPDVMEIVDIEQFVFSNAIAENRKILNAMPYEQAREYEYCDVPEEFKNGYSAACLLGINHNAGPRAIFGCAQVKQSIGCLSPDIRNKIDNGIHVVYPEQPCIVSMGIKLSMIADNTFGQHVNVALVSQQGMNQEDAIVVRRGFLENCGMNILSTKKVQVEIPNENFRAPTPDYTQHNYSKFSHHGVPRINSILVQGDAYAKNVSTRIINTKADEAPREPIKSDISEAYSDLYPSRVSRIQIENSDKVRVRLLTIAERKPIMGDKFTSRTSQKGTISKIADDDDLPYLEDGTRPDFIVNSTGIYSRKTIAMLIEFIMTNAFIQKPLNNQGQLRFINLPSFNDKGLENYLDFGRECISQTNPDLDPQEIEDELFCEKTLYNPDTHMPYKSKFMVGQIYYLRLRHMILDKVSIRSRGRKTKLTKQPNEGRKKGGGIKFGEMERDCLIAHGATMTLHEILHDAEEDRQNIKVCDMCSDILVQEHKGQYSYWICQRCAMMKRQPNYSEIDIPHTVKVFKTQIAAQGIKIKFNTKKDPSLFYSPLR